MTIKFFDHKHELNVIHYDLKKRLDSVITAGRFIQGPEVRELEERLAEYVGVNHCVSVSSGTDALLVSLMAIGVGPGDEIIIPAFSYIAAAEMVRLLGAKPVYVDVNERTYNIDIEKVSGAINSRTRAVIAVDLFGQPADYQALNTLLDETNITLIEDAAQSFGAFHAGHRACSLADIAITSFFPTKPLACYGDGGAIFTNDQAFATSFKEISQHGQKEKYHHVRLGLNARLDTLQAAVLLAKLPFFDSFIEKRHMAAKYYDELLEGMLSDIVEPPFIEPNNSSVYAQYTIAIQKRDHVRDTLSAVGIPTAVHYPKPCYKHWGEDGDPLDVTERVCASVISLPMYPGIPKKHQLEVVDKLKESLTSM